MNQEDTNLEQQIFLVICKSMSFPGYFFIEKRRDKFGRGLSGMRREFLSNTGKFGPKLGNVYENSVANIGCYYKSKEEADETIRKYFDVESSPDEQ